MEREKKKIQRERDALVIIIFRKKKKKKHETSRISIKRHEQSGTDCDTYAGGFHGHLCHFPPDCKVLQSVHY